MSLMDGLSGLGAGLGAFAGSALKDEETRMRAPLMNSAPAVASQAPTPPESAPEKVAQAALASAVPPDLLPIYQAAAKRTGIPVDVLIAQGKQESGFNPDAVSKTGAIGIAQILPSTAANPGFGLKPIDPSSLRDPKVAIAFQADYMRARAGPDADFSNPATVDAALRTYNGNSDPNYVTNVRRHMGAA